MPTRCARSQPALEALECRRLLSAGAAAAGHAGLVFLGDDRVTLDPHAIAADNPDRPDHPLRGNPAAPDGSDGSSSAGARRLAQIGTDNAGDGDEQDDIEDLPLSNGAAAGGPDARSIAAAIPPAFSTTSLGGDTSNAGDAARPLVMRASRAVVEQLGQSVASVLEARRAREPVAGVMIIGGGDGGGLQRGGGGAASDRGRPAFVAAAAVARGAIDRGAGAALSTAEAVHASAEAVGIAVERVRRALLASGAAAAAAAGEIAAVAMPPSLAAGWPDAMVTFGDALANFAHESATVGTIFAVAAQRHTRAWAVTFAVVGADAILLGRSYASHRRRKRLKPVVHALA